MGDEDGRADLVEQGNQRVGYDDRIVLHARNHGLEELIDASAERRLRRDLAVAELIDREALRERRPQAPARPSELPGRLAGGVGDVLRAVEVAENATREGGIARTPAAREVDDVDRVALAQQQAL